MINEKLYDLLQSAYGGVKVLRPGMAMSCSYPIDPQTDRVRLDIKKNGQGEEFRLDCPLCGDTRGRLHINHRWGVYDKKTKTRNLYLANCYNEQCFSKYERQRELYDNVYGTFNVDTQDLAKPSVENKPLVVQEVELPGVVWPLADMIKRSPTHHSLQYLRDRLIDPEMVAEPYDLSYCIETHVGSAENRIIVPMKQGGRMVGWQARYIGEPESKDIRKYHTGAGTALNLIWYNSDVALTYYTKVIVEGCIDAWMVGPQAMGIFNKKIGDARLQTLYRLVNRMEDVGNFVLLLDPDQNPKDAEKGHRHHIEFVFDLFQKKFPGRVMKVYLPSRTDPGSLDRSYIWALINKVAQDRNFEISDRRIKRKEGKYRKWSPKSNESRPLSIKTDRSGQ